MNCLIEVELLPWAPRLLVRVGREFQCFLQGGGLQMKFF
jgi:hypothetical protein